MIFITAVHMEGGEHHEHIAEVRWQEPATGAVGATARDVMVEWVRGGGVAWVAGEGNPARVFVVEVVPPHLRTGADGNWTNNLLALPRY